MRDGSRRSGKRILAHGATAEARTLLSAAQAITLWQRVIEDSGAALADVRGAAALASEAWSHVHAWGAGGESWRSWRQQGDEQDPSLFAAWADTYLARTRRLGVVDMAQAADVIAAQAAVIATGSTTILLVGFIELTPQQARLFTALEGVGATLREVESLPSRDARVSRTTAATPRDEIAAALCWARAIAIERPGARIGIVVENLAERRDDVLALAQDILDPASILPGRSRSGAPFELSLGVRLAQVPLVAAALDLIALCDAPLTLGAAATLLRSPYLPDADALWQRHAALERRWLEQGVRTVSLGDAIAAIAPYASELAARWAARARGVARRACDDAARMGGPLARLARSGRLARLARARQRGIPGARSVGEVAGAVCLARCRGATSGRPRGRRQHCRRWQTKPCSSPRAAMQPSRFSACWKAPASTSMRYGWRASRPTAGPRRRVPIPCCPSHGSASAACRAPARNASSSTLAC